jgi:hypothetical protein
MTKRDMTYKEFRKDYFSQHAWGDIARAGIDTCPVHPARARRKVAWRPEVTTYVTDSKHITVHITMNPYYSPKQMGLELIATVEEDESYQFHIVAAWVGTVTETFHGHRATTYRIFWAADSGCSCPSPFEDYTSIETLTVYNGSKSSYQELVAAVEDVAIDDASRVDFLRQVQAAYREHCQ